MRIFNADCQAEGPLENWQLEVGYWKFKRASYRLVDDPEEIETIGGRGGTGVASIF